MTFISAAIWRIDINIPNLDKKWVHSTCFTMHESDGISKINIIETYESAAKKDACLVMFEQRWSVLGRLSKVRHHRGDRGLWVGSLNKGNIQGRTMGSRCRLTPQYRPTRNWSFSHYLVSTVGKAVAWLQRKASSMAILPFTAKYSGCLDTTRIHSLGYEHVK